MDGWVRIGRVQGPHGVRGWIKIRPTGESGELFAPGRDIRLNGRFVGEETRRILECRPHGNALRVRLDGVDDRDAAESLAGADATVPRDQLPAPEADSFYWDDLVGLRVYETGDPEDLFLGRLESIIETGSNDVYVVRDGDRETLVPALAWVVERVDLSAGVMRVTLPEGL